MNETMTNNTNQIMANKSKAVSSKPRSIPRRRGASVYDGILWRLQPQMEDQHGLAFSVGITACDRRSGTTTLAANLANRAADHGMGPVLLVDTNASHPGLTAKYRLKNSRGLADLLIGDCQACDAVQSTKNEGLSILPIGSKGMMDRVGIEPQHLAATINGLRESYGMIVFDLPPAMELMQTLIIARQLDSVLLTVNSGVTTKNLARRAAHQLRGDGVSVSGAILNRHREYVPNWLRKRF